MSLTEYHVDEPGPIQVLTGRVGLTVAQALRREHALRPTDEGVVPPNLRRMDPDADAGIYEAIRPLQFKPGETFRWDGVPPKERAHAVHQIGEDGETEPVEPGGQAPEDEAGLQRQVEALGVEYKVEPMRQTLDELEVAYPDKAKKAELARILVDNVEPDGGEGEA